MAKKVSPGRRIINSAISEIEMVSGKKVKAIVITYITDDRAIGILTQGGSEKMSDQAEQLGNLIYKQTSAWLNTHHELNRLGGEENQ